MVAGGYGFSCSMVLIFDIFTKSTKTRFHYNSHNSEFNLQHMYSKFKSYCFLRHKSLELLTINFNLVHKKMNITELMSSAPETKYITLTRNETAIKFQYLVFNP